MHQSGHWRPHSMHAVQFSSLRAMTPRARGWGASFTCGYCTVTVFRSIVRNVAHRPFTSPWPYVGRSPVWSWRTWMSLISEHHLGNAGGHDVDQGQGDEELPGELLELVLAQARVGEPEPEQKERHQEGLEEQDDRPEELQRGGTDERHPVAAEEQRRRDGRQGDDRRDLAQVEH